MYLVPWQIFAFGCVCGVVITLIVLAIAIANMVMRSGVKVERTVIEKEEEEDERV